MSGGSGMRIALLSDIHGNLTALEAVLADMRTQGPFDQVVVAGDLVWAGPRPAEVVDAVEALNAAVIQGNTDAFFRYEPGEAPPGKREDRFVAHLEWMQTKLGPERAAYLAGLPFSHRIEPAPGQALLIVHANPRDQERAILPRMDQVKLDGLLADTGDWAALAFGHLHIPFTLRWRDRLLADVASTGLVMDGDRRAAYAILTWDRDGWHAEHRRVFYSLPIVTNQMRTCGMPRGKHFAERLMSATYGPAGPVAAD
jgi:predicted phosphodiesterase